MTTDQKKFCDEIGKCELCGSRRNLEVHHMIPMVCEPVDSMRMLQSGSIKLDVEDNWIVLCSACHSRLTPKKLLTRLGIYRSRLACYRYEVYKDFCEYIEDCLTKFDRVETKDYFDAIEHAVFGKIITEESEQDGI